MELWNIYLGSCTNEFNPFGSFIASFFFFTNHYNSLQLNPRDVYKVGIHVLIYDLYNLGMIIDVCLQLLIDEINQLWSFEEFTYDISRKQESIAFQEIIMVVNYL
jgi:hypothetical protein